MFFDYAKVNKKGDIVPVYKNPTIKDLDDLVKETDDYVDIAMGIKDFNRFRRHTTEVRLTIDVDNEELYLSSYLLLHYYLLTDVLGIKDYEENGNWIFLEGIVISSVHPKEIKVLKTQSNENPELHAMNEQQNSLLELIRKARPEWFEKYRIKFV